MLGDGCLDRDMVHFHMGVKLQQDDFKISLSPSVSLSVSHIHMFYVCLLLGGLHSKYAMAHGQRRLDLTLR